MELVFEINYQPLKMCINKVDHMKSNFLAVELYLCTDFLCRIAVLQPVSQKDATTLELH